ncbi:MAG: Hpt domain-containing protein [Oligoflexus sp.]
MEAQKFNHVNPKILQSIAHHSHNRSLPAELVRIFKEDVRQLLQRFDQALEERDVSKLQFLAHRIKGSALNVGAKSMAEICATIERSLGDKHDWNKINQHIKRLNALMEQTSQEFSDLLHGD